MTLHAWYSATMAERTGSLVYARADGTEVVVTTLTRTPAHGVGFDDIEERGEVETFVRRLSWGTDGKPEMGR